MKALWVYCLVILIKEVIKYPGCWIRLMRGFQFRSSLDNDAASLLVTSAFGRHRNMSLNARKKTSGTQGSHRKCLFTIYKKIPEILVGNFRSVRTVRVVYHLPKISGLSRRARLDSSYNMKLVRNSRNL